MKRSKKKQPGANYLDRVPVRGAGIPWHADEDGRVTLDIENKGVANRLAQLLLRKPKVSHIHLDPIGSFVWQRIDGETSILALGEQVEAEFGDKAKPTYERLATYFQTLDSYRFIEWRQETC